MKRKLITITVLIGLAGLAAVSCQQEAAEPQAPGEGILVEIPIALEQPGAAEADTKVDANLTTGVCTWTYGDQVAVYVSGSGANAYRNGTVNISNNTLAIDVEPGQSLANYAVYPAGFQDGSNNSGATPGVIYPATYSFTGHKDLSTGTYIMTPMMAVTGTDVMNFYHVGGMLRLALSHVPTYADKMELTFVGMTNVCGTCTVTNPGTSKATTAISDGGGNVLTVTDFTRSETMYVNVPLPCGDYSSLTAIRVKVLDGSDNQLANVSKTATGWGTLKHGYARIVPVDFSVDALGSVKLSADTPVTLWKSQTIQRTAKALYGDGLPFADATITWSSNDNTVCIVNQETGLVTTKKEGTARITATATSQLDGSTHSAYYDVYVNAFTGISLTTSREVIQAGENTLLVATLTHTNNGTVIGYPSDLSIGWSSSNPSFLNVSSTSSAPVFSGSKAMMAVVGIANGGSATITASIPASYSSTGAIIQGEKIVKCEIPTTISGGIGTFREYYISPGVLVNTSGTYSLTDGSDFMELLTHRSTSSSPLYYHQRATIISDVSANKLPEYSSGNRWSLPTNGDWSIIMDGTPEVNIKLNGGNLSKGFALVYLDLSGTAYAGQGISEKDGSYVRAKSGSNYVAGLLLIPDGANIACQRLNLSECGKGTVCDNNPINVSDLNILMSGGCVFLPMVGNYYSNWSYTGETAYYYVNGGNGSLYITANGYFQYNYTTIYGGHYIPAHVVHK